MICRSILQYIKLFCLQYLLVYRLFLSRTRAHSRSFCPARPLQQNITFLVVVSTLLLQRSCLGQRTFFIHRHCGVILKKWFHITNVNCKCHCCTFQLLPNIYPDRYSYPYDLYVVLPSVPSVLARINERIQIPIAFGTFKFLSSVCFALLSVSFVSHKPTKGTGAKKCCPTRNQLCEILNKHVSAGRARRSSNWKRCSSNGIKPACTSLRVTTGCLLPYCLPFTEIIFTKTV